MASTTKARFVLLGSGRQGTACAAFLLDHFPQATIDLVDVSAERLGAAEGLLDGGKRVARHEVDVTAAGAAASLFSGAACVISCVPYFFNVQLTRAALAARAPFTDLGGNVGTVAQQLALDAECRKAGVAIAPDCGLAPGLLNILAEYWADDWKYRDVRLYCGGLPQHPRGLLQYALTFNVCGLLNEYFDDCQVSRGGKLVTVPGMSEVEHLNDLPLKGRLEAFATSGGASLGAKLYAAKGIDYQYKTIRYPGHRDIIVSMQEQGFFATEPQEFRIGGKPVQATPRDLAGQIMAASMPSDGKDLVVARAGVLGETGGKTRRGRIDLLDYAAGRFTAMERTTGFPTAITAAALAGLYPECRIAPGAYVPLQIIPPKLMIRELARGGVSGIRVGEA